MKVTNIMSWILKILNIFSHQQFNIEQTNLFTHISGWVPIPWPPSFGSAYGLHMFFAKPTSFPLGNITGNNSVICRHGCNIMTNVFVFGNMYRYALVSDELAHTGYDVLGRVMNHFQWLIIIHCYNRHMIGHKPAFVCHTPPKLTCN